MVFAVTRKSFQQGGSKMDITQATDLKTLLSRRTLIRSIVAGTAVVTAMRTIGGDAAAAEERIVVWGKVLEATLYDPATSILASSWELLHTIYEGLTDLDADMKPIPRLAESWEQPNPTTYIFKLRKGVKFSNGREMTSDDVVGSLRRLIDPKTGSFFGGQMGKVKAISSDNSGSVTIELEEPYAPLMTALASTMASIIPMKELTLGSFDPSKAMLGTGPFMVESHSQGDNWVLVRNPHYWQAGLPKVGKLIVRIIPSEQALVAGLRDGIIDIAQFDASPDAPLLLKGVQHVRVIQNEQTNSFWMFLNAVAKDSPFVNSKVRQAIALAIDRNAIAQVAMGGNGLPTSAMPPIFNVCDTSKLPIFARNVEKAKVLLKEAGAEGLTFELLFIAEVNGQAIGQVIKSNLAEVGIVANLSAVDEGTFVKRVWVNNPGTFQATLAWYAGYSDPSMLPLWWIPKEAGFTAGYQMEDAKLIESIHGLRGLAINSPSRPEVLQKVCSMIDAQANQIPLVTRVETMAYRNDRIDASAIVHKDGYADNLKGVATYTRL
jgi:peptide/nickel transport system substrate-binding protein